MKFNFDFTLVDFNGENITDAEGVVLHAARTAARLILQDTGTGTDVMLKWDWAQQLHETNGIDLDKAGQEKFKRYLQDMQGVSLIVRGRLIEVLDKRKEEFNKQ